MVGRQYLVHWPQHNPCLSPKLQIQRVKLKLCIFPKLEREQDIFNIRIAMNEEEGEMEQRKFVEFSCVPKNR